MSIGIIAALPREVSALVQGWERLNPVSDVHVYTRGQTVVACAGMGEARATLAVQTAMATMPLMALLSVGLAGAVDPALRVGDIVRAGVVIDERTGERFENGRFKQILVTSDSLASLSDKTRLRATRGAAAVDMEAAAVARIARTHQLEFQAIKAISDESDFEIESLRHFATADGQFREGPFALHAALRPQMWGKLITLARNSNRALKSLTAAVERELDWYKSQRN
jgi:adenosylhomocysteine nucleosidase